jgi:alpha-ketoglutaric semialdehyde dehydrogenase
MPARSGPALHQDRPGRGREAHRNGEILDRETSGLYLQSAVFIAAGNSMCIARKEIFGAVASVIRASDYDEAVAMPTTPNSASPPRSAKYASHFKRNSEVGMDMVNLPTAGVDYYVPYGVRKGSSYGARDQGAYAREILYNRQNGLYLSRLSTR